MQIFFKLSTKNLDFVTESRKKDPPFITSVTCTYYAQRDEVDRVASSNMRTTWRKTCTDIGSSVVRALVAKTKGPGFKSPPSHAVPFFIELSSIYLLSCEHSLVTFFSTFNNKKWRTLGLNQSRRLASQKYYQQATAVTGRTSTNRRYIVIGRLAYFVLSYSYVYPHT